MSAIRECNFPPDQQSNPAARRAMEMIAELSAVFLSLDELRSVSPAAARMVTSYIDRERAARVEEKA